MTGQLIYRRGKEKIEKGQGHLSEEKIRLVYLYIQHGIYQDLIDWMETQYGAIIIVDIMSFFKQEPFEDFSSPRQMFKALAHKLVDMPMATHTRGPAEYFFDNSLEMCRGFKADAAV